MAGSSSCMPRAPQVVKGFDDDEIFVDERTVLMVTLCTTNFNIKQHKPCRYNAFRT